MKSVRTFVFLVGFILLGIGGVAFANVAFPPVGGTGTSTLPLAGQVLIGNSSSTYTPSYLTAGSGVTISTSSGGITINSSAGTFTTTTIAGITSLNFILNSPSSTIRISTSSNIISLDLSSLNISQFTNNSGYLTATTTINGLSATSYTIATGTSGNGLNIATSAPGTITFNLPDAANGISGLVNSVAQSFGGAKTFLAGLTSNTTSTFNVSGVDQFQIITNAVGGTANSIGLVYNTTTTSPGCGSHFSYANVNTGSTTADGTQFGINCAGAGIINNLEATPLLFGTNGTFQWMIDPNGNLLASTTQKLGIGTTTPATALSIVGQETLSSLGTGLVKSTAGVLGNATSGVDYQNPITFPIPVASTSLVVSPSPSLTISGNTLTLAQQINSTSSPQFLGVTSTNVTATHATTTDLSFAGDSTVLRTAYKSFGFNVYNASTTQNGASSTIQRVFYQAMTIKQIDCSTDGASVTIGADERASSTPGTLGTNVFNGGSLTCTSSGVSTSTFANATIAANALLNFGITAVANATTTLRVSGLYSND